MSRWKRYCGRLFCSSLGTLQQFRRLIPRSCLVFLAIMSCLWEHFLQIITGSYKPLNIVGMRFMCFFFCLFFFSFIIYLPRKAQLKSHLPSGNLCGPALHYFIKSTSEFLENGVCMADAGLQSLYPEKFCCKKKTCLWGTHHVGCPLGNSFSLSCKFRELLNSKAVEQFCKGGESPKVSRALT